MIRFKYQLKIQILSFIYLFDSIAKHWKICKRAKNLVEIAHIPICILLLLTFSQQ